MRAWVFGAALWWGASSSAAVTFSRDVALILYRHCAGCHRPGEIGPFPLLSYQDAARRARQIAEAAASRRMPPWLPEPGYGRFQHERRLTARQIEILQQWAAAGAPAGDLKQLPPAPRFPEGWQLGRPDLVARMPRPFAIPAVGHDLYQCFVIPLDLDRDRYVKAVEFRPSDRRVVHHAIFFVDRGRIARQKGENYSCFGTPGFLPTAALGGWTPGSSPVQLPEGVATTLDPNSELVIQIHFHTTGKPETEQSELGLYFAAAPATRRMLDIPLGSHQIDIPPGERAYKVRDHFTVPIDVEALGIVPHAHYICKDMRGWAILPDGSQRWLIWIRDWNFNWQDQYHYATPVRLPAGTRLEMEFTYDNSEQNPRNPNHPPRRVVWGPETTDEMAGLHVQVVAEREAEVSELTQALWGKLMRMVGGSFYRLPR